MLGSGQWREGQREGFSVETSQYIQAWTSTRAGGGAGAQWALRTALSGMSNGGSRGTCKLFHTLPLPDSVALALYPTPGHPHQWKKSSHSCHITWEGQGCNCACNTPATPQPLLHSPDLLMSWDSQRQWDEDSSLCSDTRKLHLCVSYEIAINIPRRAVCHFCKAEPCLLCHLILQALLLADPKRWMIHQWRSGFRDEMWKDVGMARQDTDGKGFKVQRRRKKPFKCLISWQAASWYSLGLSMHLW